MRAGTLLAATLALLACGRGDRVGASVSTISIQYSGGDPWLFGPALDDQTKFLVFLPLARFADACREGEHWGLAERWEHSGDYRRWTIHLRRNVRWHDGVPVTARDIEFSIRLWKHPEVAWYGGFDVDSVEVLDDFTLTLHLRRPSGYPLAGWDVFYPKHLLEGLEPKEFFRWEFWTRPVGNGPYRYVRHEPEVGIELEANPDFYAGRPEVDGVVIRLSDAPALTELLSGNVDAAGIAPADVVKLAGDERFRVYYGGAGGAIRLVWNPAHPPLADKVVRRALTLAIDRRGLARALDLPDEMPITDGVYTSCQFERRAMPAALPYDPHEARRLLDAAGWRDEDGDGVRERLGRPLRFVTIVDRDARWVQAATFAQDQLRRVGVRMEVQVLEQGVVAPRYRRGDFEAAIPRMAQPDSFFPAPNWYQHPRVRELLPLLARTFEREAQERIYRELSEVFLEELPATFLFPRIGACAAHRRITGLDCSSGMFGAMHRARIREAR